MGFLPQEALEYGRTVRSKKSGSGHTFDEIIGQFPPTLKQAMYAAANKTGGLKQGTWNGCALNEAGKVQGQVVSSTFQAADVFGISSSLATEFISRWDAMTASDTVRTQCLVEALLKAGLTTPAVVPGAQGRRSGTKIISSVVFKGTQSEFIEQLEKVESLADMPGFSDLHIEAVAELIGC